MMEHIKWKETWAADLSGVVLSFIRIRLANLFRAYHEVVICSPQMRPIPLVEWYPTNQCKKQWHWVFVNSEKTRLLSQAQRSPGSLAGLFSQLFRLGKRKRVPAGPAESGDSLGGAGLLEQLWCSLGNVLFTCECISRFIRFDWSVFFFWLV